MAMAIGLRYPAHTNVDSFTHAYYELALKARYLEAEGTAFQDFFSSLMELRYPGDFARVRPWGKLGDRKNDGYLRSQRMLFQCYGPTSMTLAKQAKKINEDFGGALPYWKAHFDTWVYTHNDKNGLIPDILKLLLDLSEQHKPVVLTHWGYPELLILFKGLQPSGMATLLGPAPGRADIVGVRVDDVRKLLDHIALQPEPLSVDVRPVPAAKIQYNQLSDAVATLLKGGMTRADVVKKYLRGLADQTRYDRTAAAFRAQYEALKQTGTPPDEIFVGLQKFVAGAEVATPSHQAATLAILAFFFEACEIFERPPSTVGASS